MKEKNYSAEIANAIKSYLKEDEIRSPLNELIEGEGELGEMLAKLSKRLGSPDEDDGKSSNADFVPAMIKTGLLGTEGDDD